MQSSSEFYARIHSYHLGAWEESLKIQYTAGMLGIYPTKIRGGF